MLDCKLFSADAIRTPEDLSGGYLIFYVNTVNAVRPSPIFLVVNTKLISNSLCPIVSIPKSHRLT